MEMKDIDLTKCNNCRYKAKVDDEVDDYGRICVAEGGGLVFLRSDREDGYIATWHCDVRDIMGISGRKVTDFEIVPRDPETYQDWQVGDVIGCLDEDGDMDIIADHLCRVIFRSGELVAIAENYSVEEADINGCYTCSQLFREGYRLVLTDIEQQIIEERKKAEWKPQDGDICYAELISDWVFIKKDGEFLTENYAALKLNDGYTNFDNPSRINNDAFVKMIRIATEGEKQKLFDAMEKKGKRWNAKKKVVEDIPKPYEFKKGEPVLVRDSKYNKWRIAAYISRDITGSVLADTGKSTVHWKQCIPYNERTMHLLGTTEDYKEEQAI